MSDLTAVYASLKGMFLTFLHRLPELVLAIIVFFIFSLDTVLKDPAPDALVVDLAASTVNIRARWSIKPRQSDLMLSTSEVLTAIKQSFSEAGIDLPLPTSQVLFHDQTEETDGDRTKQREGWPAKKDGNPKSRLEKQQAALNDRAGRKPERLLKGN